MFAKRCALLLVLFTGTACDKSTDETKAKPAARTIDPELAKASGLSCYFPDIADAENLLVRLDGGEPVGLAIDYTGPEDSESRVKEGSEFSAAPKGAAPLGTYEAKVRNETIELVLTGTGSGEYEQYVGHLVNYEGSAKRKVNCYRFTKD